MKDELVTFETAKLAKEKGFNIPCRFLYYTWLGKFTRLDNEETTTNEELSNQARKDDISLDTWITAPTQSLLQRWLREAHNIYVQPLPNRDSEINVEFNWYYTLIEDSENLPDIFCDADSLGASEKDFDTYEQAFEVGLQEGLKLI